MENSDHTIHSNTRQIDSLTLPRDVLWSIFSINADLFGCHVTESLSIETKPFESSRDPLLNLRYSSQVCSTWRGIILESPSLWARSIDLDRLIYLKRPGGIFRDRFLWFDEVLRRAARAPLWVKGSNIFEELAVRIVLELLEREWDRIERLVVRYIGAYPFKSGGFKDILMRPAPYLKQFLL